MKTVSLKIGERDLSRTDEIVRQLDQSRNSYINEAILAYNRQQERRLLAEQLAFESALVREESMEVLAEMELAALSDLPDA